ncbi:Chitin bind 3 domain containing protein, partial [Asbolus verrucosus]
MFLSLSIFVLCLFVDNISGHGMMLEPPNRSSLWRFNPKAPVNYDDDQNYCGGMNTQWDSFGGKCGVCGDQYDDPHPQANENTGKYGRGIIAREYTAGSVIDINILLTTNHMGFFNFSLCVLEDPNAPESGEDCFKPVTLGDGSENYKLPNKEEVDQYKVNTTVKLPDGLSCERCVLRWTYTADAPINYDDDQNYCGGMTVQWNRFGGKCGVCGDQYDDPHPQANENTGTYGQGIIAKEYTSGDIIDVNVELTTNHRGFFNFSLCILQDSNGPESGEDCFQPLTLGDESRQHKVVAGEMKINTTVKLPDGVTCDRCVLRWHYQA